METIMNQDMSQATHSSAPAVAPMDPLEVTVNNPGEVTVRIENKFGKVWLWGWNTGFTGSEDYVAVYKAVDGKLPDDPWGAKEAFRYVKHFGDAFDTGLAWGPGWIAAYVAKDFRRGMTLGYV